MTAVGGAEARGNENGRHQPDGTYYLGPGRSAGYAVFDARAEFRPTPKVKLSNARRDSRRFRSSAIFSSGN